MGLFYVCGQPQICSCFSYREYNDPLPVYYCLYRLPLIGHSVSDIGDQTILLLILLLLLLVVVLLL